MDITQAAAKFAIVARRYCNWAESAPGDPPIEMQQARELLSELHRVAIGLPEVPHLDDVDVQGRTYEQYQATCQRFGNLPVDGYWDVLNPLKIEANEATYQTLSDALADIYGDVKRGLSFYKSGHMNNAVFEWRLLFMVHWGQHLISAQRAIHDYFADTDL